MIALPLFAYPSTIAWVDDDKLFLQAIARMLGEEKYYLKIFNEPYECLKFFENYTPLSSSVDFFRACTEYDNYDALDHLPVDLNIKAFTQLHAHPMRMQEISVIVVDYNMPNMNGLDLYRKLQKLPMKKILLTGELNHPQAVAAFNEGIIDRFIHKASPTLNEEIKLHCDILMQQYFFDNTSNIISHLEVDQSLPISDAVFISFFKNWCDTNNIREYYLTNKQGNFILVNEKGNVFSFVIYTDKMLDAFVELHDDDNEVAHLIQKVSKREIIPFFGNSKEAWQIEPGEWENYFYSPQIIKGKEKYYWRVVTS